MKPIPQHPIFRWQKCEAVSWAPTNEVTKEWSTLISTHWWGDKRVKLSHQHPLMKSLKSETVSSAFTAEVSSQVGHTRGGHSCCDRGQGVTVGRGKEDCYLIWTRFVLKSKTMFKSCYIYINAFLRTLTTLSKKCVFSEHIDPPQIFCIHF